jgi:2-dehydropantoate 2-reductase
MRIAIFGAGGVGGYFGGRLAEAGNSVVFIARGPQLEAIRRHGLRVESIAGDFAIQPAEATDSPAAAGPVEAVLMCVKAWQVRAAALAMRPLLAAGTFAVPLENGVEAAGEIAAVIGEARVLGGLCRVMSYVAAPGVVRHAGVQPSLEFGERDGSAGARAQALLAACAPARGMTARVSRDIEAATWEKFLFIAPFSGVGALTGLAAGGLRADPGARAMLEAAMREVEAVARARGARVREDIVARTMGFVDALPADATASMQRDILAGRPSELEQQNGAVVRLGGAAGVAVPVNARIYEALRPAEERARAAARVPAP